MITGHIALAYAAGARRRERRLLWLFGASLAPDIVDVGLAVAGICSPYGLYSHALPSLALEAALAALVCWVATRDRGTALFGALLVLAHLPLDLVTGSKVWWPYLPQIGLDLYKVAWADLAIEIPLVVAGWTVARRAFGEDAYFAKKWVIVALVALQCTITVLGTRQMKAPVTSQSPSCRATYKTR